MAQAAEIASDVVAYLFLGKSELPNLADIGAGESNYGHNSHAAVITQPSHHKKNAAAAFRADIRSHL